MPQILRFLEAQPHRRTAHRHIDIKNYGGMIDTNGAQTCLGKFVRDDRLAPANGWWELICPDDSYAAGNFRLTEQGTMQGTGTAVNGEKVTFDLPIGD